MKSKFTKHMTDKTPNGILSEYPHSKINYVKVWARSEIFKAMKEYGDQQWNAALEAAAEDARCMAYTKGFVIVDPQSILSLKR